MLKELASQIKDLFGKKTIADAKALMPSPESANALGAVWAGQADDNHITLAAQSLNSEILKNVGVEAADINKFIRLRNAAGIKPGNVPKNTATWSKGRKKSPDEDDAVKAAYESIITPEFDNAVYEGRIIVPANIVEKLDASSPVEDWIDDFVNSTNPKFDGKSKKERINMALGAYYAAQKGESFDPLTIDEKDVTFSDDQIAKLKEQYSGLATMDPKRLPAVHALLDALSPAALKQISQADIKFISPLAKNAMTRGTPSVKKESVDNLDEMSWIHGSHAEHLIAKHSHGLDIADPHHKRAIEGRIAKHLGKKRVLIQSNKAIAHEGEVFADDVLAALVEAAGKHDFIQQELADKDVNVKRVQKHPTQDHHQIVVDKDDMNTATATVRRHGLDKEYHVIGEDTIVENHAENDLYTFSTSPMYDRSKSNQPDLIHAKAHKGKLASLNIPHPHAKDGEYGDAVVVSVTHKPTGATTHHAVYQSGYASTSHKPLMSIRSYGKPQAKSSEHAEALAAHLGKKLTPSWK